MSLKSVNPYNGKLIKTYKEHTSVQIEEKIKQGNKAWLSFKQTDFTLRKKCMLQLAKSLIEEKEKLARTMALEMGKPLKDGTTEIEKCASVCEYYANNAEDFLSDEIIETEASKSFVTYQPVGLVLAIMPWNFPFWQAFRFLAPALMAGNCGLLKHASNVSACALAIEELVIQSGFPKHSFQTLLIGSKKLEPIIAHPLVKAVTLTGSTAAGKKVAAQAGSLIKKTVLELGGSDAYIILEDADLELTAETCVNSRLINNGQSCISAKRFIVMKSVEKEFVELFKNLMKQKTIGDPLEDQFDLGPMARTDLRDDLHEQVSKSIKLGAKCILGGKIPKGNAAIYPPTILTNVKKGMPAYDEELFGPVAAIITVKNEEEAIKTANDSIFGLGAAVFTKDLIKGELIAKERIEAGSCFVNSLVKSDPRLPFGGIKESGYGRELSIFGIKEFVNIKTVYIK